MFCIAYLSSATARFGEDELSRLLETARRSNEKYAITGMLCYHEGNFLQFLEGEKSAVERIFEAISRDPRHSGIMELFNGPIQGRLFPEWSMALVRLEQFSPEQQAVCKHLKEVRADPADGLPHRGLVDAFLDVFRLSVR